MEVGEQKDLEFSLAFQEFLVGRRAEAYDMCYKVIKSYCDHAWIEKVGTEKNGTKADGVKEEGTEKDGMKVDSTKEGTKEDGTGVEATKEARNESCLLCKLVPERECSAFKSVAQITRWYCLFSFIQFRMLLKREINTNRKIVRDMVIGLKNARKMIYLNHLEHDNEFAYLSRECLLKAMVLECDHLLRPWSAYKTLKQVCKELPDEKEIKKKRRVRKKPSTTTRFDDDDGDQVDTIREYEAKIMIHCMLWYVGTISQKKRAHSVP